MSLSEKLPYVYGTNYSGTLIFALLDSTSAALKSLVRKARETRAERRVHRLRDVYGRAKRETETATETETETPTYPDEPLYSEIAKMPDSLLKDGDSIITKVNFNSELNFFFLIFQ